MDAKELRIGNLVEIRFINEKETSTITGTGYEKDEEIIYYWPKPINDTAIIKGKDFKVMYSMMDYVEPIHLTEEWLVKFGFVLRDNVFIHSTKPLRKGFNGYTRSKLIDCRIRYIHKKFKYYTNPAGSTTKEIKHVHQLQNLYFALVGEELTIK